MNKELSCRPGRGISMKNNHILIISSLLSILLITLHLTSDTIHARAGTPEAGGSTYWGARPGSVAVWNAAAQRTAVGARHHARRVTPYNGYACRPRDGAGRHFSRRHRQVQPSLLVRLDAARDGRDWDVLLHPLSARTVGPATGPTPVVRRTRNNSVFVRKNAVRVGHPHCPMPTPHPDHWPRDCH